MLISVIITIYNTSNYLTRCIDSIFRQDLRDVELIFIDDCSTDDSYQVAQQSLNKIENPAVRLFKNEANQGSGETRNRGIREASGDYIIFIDSDDYLSNCYFETLRENIVTHRPDILIFDYTEIYNDKTCRKNCQPANNKQQIIAELIQGKMHNSLCNKLFKRKLFSDKSVVIQKGLSMFDDKSLCFRLFEKADVISYIPQSLYFYDRTRTCSLTNRSQVDSINDALILLETINDYYSNHIATPIIKRAININKVLITGLLSLYSDKKMRTEYLEKIGEIPLYSFFFASTAPFHYRISALCYYYNFSFGLKVIRNVYFKLKRC